MIEPLNIIEPLRDDLRKQVPDTYLTTTPFKRWIVANSLQDLWSKCHEYAEREQSMFILGEMSTIIAGDAFTVLLNHLYQQDKSYFCKFIIQFLINYCHTESKSLDLRDIKEDLRIAEISESDISEIDVIMDNDDNNTEYDGQETTEEQKIRSLEKEYVAAIEVEPNSSRAVNAYLKWYSETLLYLSDFYSIANPDFLQFKSIDNSGNGYILKTNYHSILAIYNLLMKNVTKQLSAVNKTAIKTPMVFISHSAQDKRFVEALVDLLESLGFTSENMFCSSVDGYGIPLSHDIFETLRALFSEHDLYVIFIHSPRYYSSPVSLNEMGAAWVLKTDFCSILTNDMEFSEMKGVVNANSLSIKVDSEEAPARLTELKDLLTKKFSLIPMDHTKWERKRNGFFNIVKSIKS